MKRLLIFGLMAAIVSLAIVACKDDFNEEEFLRLQAELKSKQLADQKALLDSTSEQAVKEYITAANEAGDLLAMTIRVRENGNPVPGVSVILSSGTTQERASGRSKASQTGTTDAEGVVVFDRVTIGSGSVQFSKSGFISATASYYLGQPSPPTAITINSPTGSGQITKYLPPTKQFVEGTVPMFASAANAGSTATIAGFVTYESDLTNLAAEPVPQATVLRANLSSLINGIPGIFQSYTLEDDNGLGKAVIAADGSYTMVVPATAASSTITFIIPNIEGNSRVAVNGVDNGAGTTTALPAPEYRDIPTVWGPNLVYSTVPSVAGARVVVAAAPAAGSGLSFVVTPIARTISASTFISSSALDDVDNVRYRISNRGSYDKANIVTPTVTFSGGGGTGLAATATLRTLITKIDVTNRGEGYDGLVNLELVASLSGGGESILATSLTLSTPDGKLPAALNLEAIDNGSGLAFGVDEAPVLLPNNATSLLVRITNAGAAVTTQAVLEPTLITELASVNFTSTGLGYTSKPSITLSGGGATIDVLDFPTYYQIAPSMAAGTDYAVLPSFSVIIPQSPLQTGSADPNVDVLNDNGTLDVANQSLQGQLTITDGDIVKKFPTRKFRTKIQSGMTPTVLINSLEPINAKFSLSAADIDATTGALKNNPTASIVGAGYNVKLAPTVVPAITGAPGGGATVALTYLPAAYNANTMEWIFSGAAGDVSTPTKGSGYLSNLNRRSQQSAILATALDVQAGKRYRLDFVYGTGQRKIIVN